METIESNQGYYLKMSGERMGELLSRHFIVPTLDSQPTETTLSWKDGNYQTYFRIGEIVRVKDNDDYVFFRLKDIKNGLAVWVNATIADMQDYYTKQQIDDKFSTFVPDIDVQDVDWGAVPESIVPKDEFKTIGNSANPWYYVYATNGTFSNINTYWLYSEGASIGSAGLLVNNSQVATEEYVTQLIKGYVPIQTLNDYATKNWVNQQDYADKVFVATLVKGYVPLDALDSYASKQWVEQQGYASVIGLMSVSGRVDLIERDYATKAWVDEKKYLDQNNLTYINNNLLQLENTIEELSYTTAKNKGYFRTLAELQNVVPNANRGEIAYVGSSSPYVIYEWNDQWINTGYTHNDAVELENYYTKSEVDQIIPKFVKKTEDEIEDMILNGTWQNDVIYYTEEE